MLLGMFLLVLASAIYALPGFGKPPSYKKSPDPPIYYLDHRRPQWSQGHAWATGLNTSTMQNPHSSHTVSRHDQISSTSCTESDSYPTIYSTTDYDPVPTESVSYSWMKVPLPSIPTSYVHTPDTYPAWTQDAFHEDVPTTVITKTWSATSVCTTFRPTSAPVYTRHGTTFYSTSLTMSYWKSTWLTSSTSVVVIPTPYLTTETPRSHGCPVCSTYSCAISVTITHTVYAPSPYAPSPYAPSPYAPSPYAPSPYTRSPYMPNHSTDNPPQIMATQSYIHETYSETYRSTTISSTVAPAHSRPPHYQPHPSPLSDMKTSTHPAPSSSPPKTYHISQWAPTSPTRPSIHPTGSNVPLAYHLSPSSRTNNRSWSSPVKPTGGPRQSGNDGTNGHATSQDSQKPAPYHAQAAYRDQK